MCEDKENKQHTNLDLIYTYTDDLFQAARSNLNTLDTRLGTTIGFSGILLRFSFDLPGKELKIVACCIAVMAAILALLGFLPQAKGRIMTPEALLDKYYYQSEELCRLTIARQWASSVSDFSRLASKKHHLLTSALVFLCLAVVVFTLDIVVSTI